MTILGWGRLAARLKPCPDENGPRRNDGAWGTRSDHDANVGAEAPTP